MEYCCCFCGKEIEEFPNYSLVIQKNLADVADKAPSQELYCHEKCLENRLHDANWLYLKHL